MLLLCFVKVSLCMNCFPEEDSDSLNMKTFKPFVLFLWFGQHGSHHTCDANYSVFTAVPFSGKFLLTANQPTLVVLPQFWIPSCDTDILSKENSEVKKLHLKRISTGGKRTKFVHPPLYIQISKTAINALSCRQQGIKCCDKLFLSFSCSGRDPCSGCLCGQEWESWETDATPSQTFSWRCVPSFRW